MGGRFVRLLRLDSEKQNWASVRTFEVNPVRADNLGFNIEADDTAAAVNAFDKNVQSIYRLEGKLSFDVTPGTGKLTVLSGRDSRFTITQYDENGHELSAGTFTSPYSTAVLEEGTAKVTVDGKADIYEIVL